MLNHFRGKDQSPIGSNSLIQLIRTHHHSFECPFLGVTITIVATCTFDWLCPIVLYWPTFWANCQYDNISTEVFVCLVPSSVAVKQDWVNTDMVDINLSFSYFFDIFLWKLILYVRSKDRCLRIPTFLKDSNHSVSVNASLSWFIDLAKRDMFFQHQQVTGHVNASDQWVQINYSR